MKYVFVPDEGYERPFEMKMDNEFLVQVQNPEPDEFEGPFRTVSFDGYHPLTFAFAENGLLVTQEAYGQGKSAHIPGAVYCSDGAEIGGTATAPKTKELFKKGVRPGNREVILV